MHHAHPRQFHQTSSLSSKERHMASRAYGTSQAAGLTGNTNDSSLYLVLKVTNGGLQELSSQVRPGSSAHLFEIASQDSPHEGIAGQDSNPSGSRRNSFRHPKPCGGCSATKSRCTPLLSDPMLCVRCKSKNLPQCPPHVPWALRKVNGERRDSNESPQPQGIAQGFSLSLPDETVFPAMPPPVPISSYTDPYSMQAGAQLHGQYNDGSAVHTICPYVPSSSGESLPRYFHDIDTGVSVGSYSHMEPLCYPSFPSESDTEQRFTHVPDEHPPIAFPQTEGHFMYW